MAAFGFTSANTNIKVGGFASWMVTRAGDTGYVSLGDLADTRFSASLLTAKNSYAQNKPYGVRIEASAKMLCTDKSTVLLLLDHLVDAQLTHKITAINGVTYKGPWGTKWRFDSSSDYNGYRYVEVSADHSFLTSDASLTDWADVLSAPPADGSLTGALATFSAVTKYPAGMTAFETRNTGETNWETLGLFRNGKLTVECLTYQDNQNRAVVHGVRYALEAEMTQTAAAELALLDDLALGSPDFRATLADGTLFTVADATGVAWSYENSTDADGIPIIKVMGEGVNTAATVIGYFS